MQGLYINSKRPTSKKMVKEAVTHNPETIDVEDTSIYGNEYGGLLTDAPDGQIFFVGPCPHTNRKFYGTITKKGDKLTVK